MPTQQRELRKNYIGIVSDKFDEQCAVELRTKSGHLMKDRLLRLMAVVLKRNGEAK
jgi:hypothetical protein